MFQLKIPIANEQELGAYRKAIVSVLSKIEVSNCCRVQLENIKSVYKLLDRSNRLMSLSTLFTGGMDDVVIDPKIIFATALKRRCNSLILAHNHPSGTLKPSHLDIAITKQLTICGSFLELPVYDHIILSENSFYSLNDKGYINSVKMKIPEASKIYTL